MNGVHDMGGMHGFGKVIREQSEPVFHERWEGRVYGLRVALRPYLADLNIDFRRHAIERLPPDLYLRASYYERWLETMLEACLRAGLIDDDDVRLVNAGKVPSRRDATPKAPPSRSTMPYKDYRRPIDKSAAFGVGEIVRARNINPQGHTRLPRYARGKRGAVVADHGGFVFPDTNAALHGECPERLYTVRFAARELWGETAHAKDSVSLDLWEPYLERAGA
jgi:nitrile hydratase